MKPLLTLSMMLGLMVVGAMPVMAADVFAPHGCGLILGDPCTVIVQPGTNVELNAGPSVDKSGNGLVQGNISINQGTGADCDLEVGGDPVAGGC